MSNQSNEKLAKGRRVTIDLTPAAVKEVDRLRELTGLTTADMFRHAFSLFRIYVEAKQRGQEVQLIDPEREDSITRLELPVVISSTKS